MSHSNERTPLMQITRRDALGLIGGGALVTFGCTTGKSSNKNNKLVIRTLLKDIEPQTLGTGAILFHEHLSQHYPVTRAMAEKQGSSAPVHFSDDVNLMLEETRAAGKEGIGLIVDGGHSDMDRNLDALQRIARESGVHIVASGGFYMERNYP